MKYLFPLTIITPTYNRASLLHRLFISLKNQTKQNFQWIIIDDGSSDDTEKVVNGFKNQLFNIVYKKKPNGGKHTALNYAHPFIDGDFVCIVDSDDLLVSDAVERIINVLNKFKNNDNIKVFSFMKGKDEYNSVCNGFPLTPIVSNHIDFRVNGNRSGDCCEVISTEVFKSFPFPEHIGEKFMSEGYLWNNSGYFYDTLYIPEIIYICDYLDDGLTKSGRKLRISCPLGGMDNCNSFFKVENGRRVCKKILRKEMWLYVCYGKFAGLNYKELVKKCNFKKGINIINYIMGLLLYSYWKNKYK